VISSFFQLIAVRCTNRNQRSAWDTLVQCKTRILELVWSPTVSIGVKLSAVKFMQRVILVQTRGVSDPRVVFCSLSPVLQFTVDLQYIFECREFTAPKQKRPQYLILSGRPSIHLSRRIGERRQTATGRHRTLALFKSVSELPSFNPRGAETIFHLLEMQTSSLQYSTAGDH
jgi:Symplekin/PTA1 N-terminal